MWLNVEEIPLLGVFDVERVPPRWDSPSLETRRDERPNDHLLLFVSKSTKQHLFPRARSESAVMHAFLELLSWRIDAAFTARVAFMISACSVRK